MASFYTIYWTDGIRTVIKSGDIETDKVVAGFDRETLDKVFRYDVGVTDTHRWDKELQKWVEYTPFPMESTDDLWSKPFEEVKQQLIKLLNDSHELNVKFPNNDKVILQLDWGHYSFGFVHCLKLFGGEYFPYPYYEDSEFNHHYIVRASEFFKPSDIEVAVQALYERVKNNDITKASDLFGTPLKEIFDQQPSIS